MSGHRDLLHRMERFARRKVRDPMRGFLRGTPQTGQSPGRSPTLPPSAPVREPAGAETAELMHHIIGQQTMLTHHSLERLDRSLLLQGRMAANQGRPCRESDILATLSSACARSGAKTGLSTGSAVSCRTFLALLSSSASRTSRKRTPASCSRIEAGEGLIFDGNNGYMEALRQEALYWRHDLTAVPAFITAENINGLIRDADFSGSIGILSVDIDGNDYWVLEAIDCVDPAIIICEINGVFGDLRAISVPYRPDFQRMDGHYSGQYFGCSIEAARRLCSRKGYSFLGTNTNGVNTFFVRDDLAPPILAAIEDVCAWAPRHRDSRNLDGKLDFTRGLARYDLVADMPVVDLDNNVLVPLHSLRPLYSEAFLKDFR